MWLIVATFNRIKDILFLIDFLKIETIGMPDKIYNSKYLDFKDYVSTKTGEVGTYKVAYYQGLTFKVYYPTNVNPIGRITIEGSLHKYWNNGGHNYNDFGDKEIQELKKDLIKKFDLELGLFIIKQLEIGVNIIPPQPSKTILNCLVVQSNEIKDTYVKNEGAYKQVKKQNKFIKVYDKANHYKSQGYHIENEILRFEVKYRNGKELRDERGLYNLNDLFEYDLSLFKIELIKQWGKFIFFDKDLLKGHKNYFKYSNPHFWNDLNNNQKKYHKKVIEKIYSKSNESIKRQVEKLISDKIDELTSKLPQITPLYISVKRVNYNNRKSCPLTGLNISMQRIDSYLLSHTGIKYYYQNDKRIFLELKNKYLPVNWHNETINIQIKELAHIIRSRVAANNKRINKYPNQFKFAI